MARRAARTFAVFLLIGVADAASAKRLFCPPGRFVMRDDGRRATVGGTVLRLADESLAAIEGICPAAHAGGLTLREGWRPRFRVRWTACDSSSAVAGLRARFEDGCRVLRGVVRTRSGTRRPFVATRIPECGNGLVEGGEDCDDGNDAAGDCCIGCRAEPGCHVPCERTSDCAPYAVCTRYDDTCRAGSGVCRMPVGDECRADGFAVCGCDGNAYPSACAAWEVGVAVQGGDGLNTPVGSRCRCRPDVGLACRAGRFCEMPYRCTGAIRPRIGGICIDVPLECAGAPGAPVCGCDGRTYRTDCDRKRAGVQLQCRCPESGPFGAACGLPGPPTYGCDCARP
jgi:cysteine-rich repeat protein